MDTITLTILNLITSQIEGFSFSEINSSVILNKLTEIQISVSSLSIQDEPIAAAPIILLAAGVVIFLGVAGEAFFKKTGIPDVAFLMILGVIIGPVFGIIQAEAVIQVVPYFAALALIIIMFDGGLNLDIKHVIKTAHYSLTLALVGFILSVIIISVGAHYVLEWTWLESILLASIVGGSSSAIVFGLVRNIRISEKTKSILSFESAVTDILATIIAFILFEAVLAGHFDLQTLQETIGRAVVVGLVLGFGVGIPWMYISTKFANTQHAYMLTLSILFVYPVWSISEGKVSRLVNRASVLSGFVLIIIRTFRLFSFLVFRSKTDAAEGKVKRHVNQGSALSGGLSLLAYP